MRVTIASVLVDDQQKALEFYTDKLGFVKKMDLAVGGGARWLTVVSPQDPDGVQLLLEPDEHPAVKPFKEALVADGIPFNTFEVADVEAEYERMVAAGVEFTQKPMDAGGTMMAVFDDTCGNLIGIHKPPAEEG
ncbi:MAG TPA: VOC family protein [Stackebrandtia sp.]|jgi:catechol 2,3-dioxygenase-like lactoylglutathione lyase family enzyme|uniref:VOC family protein n=1 Tax=Stackebrandtia sp. TaxID=2023065 RepID=UPI002D4B570A|nr:VOC family protein [Stackebrandtia sp.]HZE41591.1 VOC family protein [Stackebrandtia sp.]